MLKAIKVYEYDGRFTVDKRYAKNCNYSFHTLLPDMFYIEGGKILTTLGEWFIGENIETGIFLYHKEIYGSNIKLEQCYSEVIGTYDTIVKLYIIYEKGWGGGEEWEGMYCSPNIITCPGYDGNSNEGSKSEILNMDEYYLPEGYKMHIEYFYNTNSTSHICYDSDGMRAVFGFEHGPHGVYLTYVEDVHGNKTILKPLWSEE